MTIQKLNVGEVHQLIQHQERLYAYILALVSDGIVAEDVLQETNLAASRMLSEAREVDNFVAWMFGVARNQVAAYRRSQGRDRFVFDDDLLSVLDDEAAESTNDLPLRQEALGGCLESLPQEQRDIILRRYHPGASLRSLATELERTVGSMSQTLYRIRMTLMKCIEGKLTNEGLE